METIRTLSNKIIKMLKEENIPEPILDTELLIMYSLNMTKLQLVMNPDRIITDEEQEKIMSYALMRQNHKPIQYITHTQEFMGIDFHVAEGVLIPRPDTEITVEKSIELLQGIKKPIIIDMCTGSGAIGISIAHYIKDATVYLCDISDVAIKCATKNIVAHNLCDRVKIIKTDLFQNVPHIKADMVVSNPPYIEKETIATLHSSVKDYEPILALDGGETGLDFYEKITKVAENYLKPNGVLIYEIGYNQKEAVKNILQENGYENIQNERDLAGLDRCIYGYLK